MTIESFILSLEYISTIRSASGVAIKSCNFLENHAVRTGQHTSDPLAVA
jgi:hypothetical protein